MFGSILLFVLIAFGLGWGTLALVTGRARTNVETLAIAPGVGLAVFAVLTVLFNPVGIPLRGWTFLAAAGVLCTAGIVRARLASSSAAREPFASRDDLFLAGAVLMAVVTFLVFRHGAFLDAWLPDDDSWEHAASAEYITVHGSYSIDAGLRKDLTSYLEPYPPPYPALMGVLHGAGAPMSWTLKFFNVLIVACAVPWFYLMARRMTGRPAAALWMTGVLWVLPCFMSRFIWAQTLSVALFFPAFYAMERARREPSWAVVFALAAAGVFLAQPSSAAIFGVMVALAWLVHLGFCLASRERPRPTGELVRLAAGALAALLLAAAFYVPAYVKFGRDEFLHGLGKIPVGRMSLHLAGTAGETTYGLRDFVWAPALQNMMNQPTGIGFALFFVLLAGVALLLLEPRRLSGNRWAPVALVWLLFTLLGVMSNTPGFPVTLFPHRFWVYFAIPVAMVAGEFLAYVASALDWKSSACALALGLALGGALVFSGISEAICIRVEQPGADPADYGTANRALFFASLALAAASVAAMLYRFAAAHANARAMAAGAVLALLVAGTIATSGYATANLQGGVTWPEGVRFYTRDGVQDHLDGFLELRATLPLNSSILSVNGSDEQVIGFDMLAWPYDPEVQKLRASLREAEPKNVDAAKLREFVDLARRRGIAYLLVDLYYAAEHRHVIRRDESDIAVAAVSIDLSRERLDELYAGAVPSPREKPVVGLIESLLPEIRDYEDKEHRELALSARLRELMKASPDLHQGATLDSGPLGIVVYEIR